MSTSTLPVRVGEQEIYVEIDRYGEEEVTSDEQALLQRVGNAFDNVQKTVANMAKCVASTINTLGDDETPDEVTLECTLRIGAEGQIILAKFSSDAQLRIEIVIRRKKAAAS